MAALPLDSVEIEELVLRFNAVLAKQGADVSDLGGNATDSNHTFNIVPKCAMGRHR